MKQVALVFLLAFLCLSCAGFSIFGKTRTEPEIRTLPSDTIVTNSAGGALHSHSSQPEIVHHGSETWVINHNGERTHYESSGSAQSGGAQWRSLSYQERMAPKTEVNIPFSFTLEPPLYHQISREAAANYQEPGWTIEDSRSREVDVSIDIPRDMRRQRPGLYDITYTAYLRGDPNLEPLGTQKRQVEVLDVNKCLDGTHDCSQYAYCIHLPESGTYRCECKPGYRGNGLICTDIDECAEGLAVCDIHATCINTNGGYECVCKQGFVKVGDVCEDIDECATGQHDCSPNAYCMNLPGSFTCKCKEGFIGDGKHCEPINKCKTGEVNCHPYANCLVLPNDEYKCECKQGFRGDGVITCDDINECEENIHNCPPHSHCRNTFGGYNCICNTGFREVNGKCEDINECAEGTHTCDQHATCFNTIGGYNCICKDGYEKNEDGHCQSLSANPNIILQGDNPLSMFVYETYSEPGFRLEEERDEMSLIVSAPPELHGITRKCGQFEITYVARDLKTQKTTSRTRLVNVLEVDRCALPDTHPFSDNCHEFARCIHLPGQCDYTCQCPPGYEGDGFGPNGCKDNVPPVLVYNGPEPFIREICRVCGTVITEPNLAEPVITKAYDNTPNGPKDISDRIVLETEPSDMEDCILHHYSVTDDSGNTAHRRLTVCVRVEDMRTTIMEMKAMYTWQMWLIRNVAFFCALALVLFCVWEFGHYIASCFRVLTKSNPSYEDYDTAYSLKYRITHPLASHATIRKFVNEKLLLDDKDEDDLDSEEDEEFEDDIYSDEEEY